MQYIIIALLIAAVIVLLNQRKQGSKAKGNTDELEEFEDSPKKSKERTPLPVQGAYQSRWLFSYNEKYAYTALKPIAEELGYIVFAKVRLLDLLEPKKGQKQYKAYFHKIQAKHVDFVLCNQNLVAEWIIELDDSSHDRPDRQERDRFVDEAVTSVGYKILHVRQITPDIRDMLQK